MAKTIVVEVTRRVPHPLYKRIVSKRKKFYAHDEEGQANVGDVVRIIECRPMSKLKRWTAGRSDAQGRAGDHGFELHRHSAGPREAGVGQEKEARASSSSAYGS